MQVALYARRSSPGEADKNYSIENQLEDMRRWCLDHDHTIFHEYIDPGAKSYTLDRPILQQLFRDARSKKFEMVIVWKFDRFSREQEQNSYAMYQLGRYGIQVISTTQPVPDGPVGTLLRNSYGFVSETELLSIRERTVKGRNRRVHQGKLSPQATPLYGYAFADPKKTRYVPDPVSSQIVRRIYALAISGMPMRAIARQLQNDGIPTVSRYNLSQGYNPPHIGTVWNVSIIYKILSNRAYIGQHRGWHIKRFQKEVIHPITGENYTITSIGERDADDPEVIYFDEQVCPAIVSLEEFEAAHALLQYNKSHAPRNIHDSSKILLRGGFLHCGYCGGTIWSLWHTKDGDYRYHCSYAKQRSAKCIGRDWSHRIKEIDDLVWEWIIDQLSHPDAIRLQVEAWQKSQLEDVEQTQDDAEAMQAMLADATRKRDKYLLAIGDADDDIRPQLIELAKAEARTIKGVEARMAERSQFIADVQRSVHVSQEIIDHGAKIVSSLQGADIDDKRKILYIFGVNIRLWDRDHDPLMEITWGLDNLREHWLLESGGEVSFPTIYSHERNFTTLITPLPKKLAHG